MRGCSARVRHNCQFQGRDIGEFYCIVLNLAGCIRRGEVPLLANDVSKRTCRVPRISQNKLLRSRALLLFEVQPDTSQSLGLIEMKANGLDPWGSGTPAPPLSEHKRGFDWKFLLFRRYLDDGILSRSSQR